MVFVWDNVNHQDFQSKIPPLSSPEEESLAKKAEQLFVGLYMSKSLMWVLKHKPVQPRIKSSKQNTQHCTNLELNSLGMLCPLTEASVISSPQMESPLPFPDRRTTPDENRLG